MALPRVVARDLDAVVRMARSKAAAKPTTDHDEIQRWAEARGGTPAAVKGTTRGRGDVGMIRIDFPGYSGAGKLQPISWDEWFQKFDDSGLALIKQEKTARGQRSNFNKLVSRETIEEREEGAKSKSGASARRARSSGGASRSKSSARGGGGRKSASTRRASSSRKESSARKGSSSRKATSSRKASKSRSSR
jgi:hypothetical protein